MCVRFHLRQPLLKTREIYYPISCAGLGFLLNEVVCITLSISVLSMLNDVVHNFNCPLGREKKINQVRMSRHSKLEF